jgi:MoaA/NifB/PqqE/SkfB family radical SAM enzyme/GT2 family glycosyltransferase
MSHLRTSNVGIGAIDGNVGPLCHRPWTGFELVDHLGDVRPCCWGKVSCGNINEQSPDQIWTGSGFKYYRDQMRRGRTEEICNSWCPILQGSYVEKPESNSFAKASVRASQDDVLVDSPEFLRVVPTTACNLKCNMCYQAGEPPARLPANLFQLLEPWIKRAAELLVMGGETFLTKQCLSWIERVNPSVYPKCGLAAITNGLGFTDEVCALIAQRRWNWILVSIDAASAAVFSKVRGGNFRALLTGLDKLAEVRAKSAYPFEVRFGFTLQNSNLRDALKFVDLCDRYNAMPQYTMVFGDWHGESPRSEQQFRRFTETIEVLDKKLWERGFGNQIVASGLSAIRSKHGPLGARSASDTIRLSKLLPESESFTIAQRKNQETSQHEASNASPGSHSEGLEVRETNSEERHFEFEIGNGRKSPAFWDNVSRLALDSYGVRIPFFGRDDTPVSALQVYPSVERLKRIGSLNRWRLRNGTVGLTQLGLDPDDCSLEFETVSETGRGGSVCASVVSPIHNRERELPLFVNSLIDQQCPEPFEIILVDDRSSDNSVRVALDALRRARSDTHVLLLKTKRKNRYKKGTFTFGAGLAREIGIRETRGSRVLFLDPDQLVDRYCLAEHLIWGRRGFQVVIGDRIEEGGDVSAHWQSLRTSALGSRSDWWLSFFTGNASVDRGVLCRAGGFDPTFQFWGLDDTDLGYRLFQLGASAWHTRRAKVIHLNSAISGGGTTPEERLNSYRLHMEVLYRKYLDKDVLAAFSFAWLNSNTSIEDSL